MSPNPAVLTWPRPVSAGGGVITDTFTRANNASSLGNTETGQAWQIIDGTWGVVNGTMYKSAGAADSRNRAVVDFGSTDMLVTITLANALGGIAYPGIIAGFENEDAYYMLVLLSQSTVIRRAGGSSATIISALGTTGAGETMSLGIKEVGGSTVVTAFRNGVQIGTYTDSLAGRPVGTKAGVYSFSSNTQTRFDNFQIEAP